MKVTVLGCGGSGGVPLVGNVWGACDPSNPRNRRRRAAILIEEGAAAILIDTPPDLREQLLTANVQRLSAVFYTHAHADHLHGIDDLRPMNWLMKKQLPVYGDAATLEEIRSRFPYIPFNQVQPNGRFDRPGLELRPMDGPVEVDGLRMIPFKQDHIFAVSWGFRVGGFAYSTDVKKLDEAAFQALVGVKVWIVDAERRAEHPSHSHLAQTLEWIERVKPEKAYLTHMDPTMDYAGLMAELPPNIEPAYDGLVIEM